MCVDRAADCDRDIVVFILQGLGAQMEDAGCYAAGAVRSLSELSNV